MKSRRCRHARPMPQKRPSTLGGHTVPCKALMAPVITDTRPEAAIAPDERIRADLARLLQARLVRESGLVVLAHPVLVAVVAALVWGDVSHDLVIGWVAAVVAATALRGMWLIIVRRRRMTDTDLRNGVRLTVTLLGLCWGVGAALVLPLVAFPTAALILVIFAGIIASALTTLTADPLTFRSFLASITLPVSFALA